MHETPAADSLTCATASETRAEPLAGTAAVAGSWLCLEQPGPWGHNALLQSRLDPALGKELSNRAEAAGVRVQLIRRPAKQPDRPRRAYLAHTVPGRAWLRHSDLTDPADLLELDFPRIADGSHDGWGKHVVEPLLLVCTNGRRDRCCALRGRALITELATHHGDSIWETTHTGGHRFAPAAVLLPTGYTYGRLDAQSGAELLSAAASGKIALRRCRGRSTWSRAGQAAELAVRDRIAEYLPDALRVEAETTGEVRVAHENGRQWAVSICEQELSPPRPNSCGKAPVRPVAIVVREIRELPAVSD